MFFNRGQERYDDLQNQRIEEKFTDLDGKVCRLDGKVETHGTRLDRINSSINELNSNTFITWTNSITIGRVIKWLLAGFVLLITSDFAAGFGKTFLLDYFGIKVDPQSNKKIEEIALPKQSSTVTSPSPQQSSTPKILLNPTAIVEPTQSLSVKEKTVEDIEREIRMLQLEQKLLELQQGK